MAEELIKEFGPLPDQPPDENEAMLWAVAGLITVADWIGSDEQHFPQDARWGMDRERERARLAFARSAGRGAACAARVWFADLFREFPRRTACRPPPCRSVSEPGVYIIEGPMGCGKTEAALAAAYQLIAAGKAARALFRTSRPR